VNIWAWVHEIKHRLERGAAPEQRLAELMNELPSAAVDEAHERVDSMVPEAVALARELDEPWAEVFVRHWNLQSRVLHRRQAGEELREAVSLLDFASGPRTRGCPQSVCAVQDLAVCYAIRDGPGYVAERLAVASETLARIDPGWACFDCISGEYFSALIDDERPAEALAFIEAQIARAAEHGEFEVGFNTTLNRARALAALDRAPEALALLDGIRDVSRFGRSRTMTHRQARIGVLLKLGRPDEALSLHPPLSTILATGGHLRDWVDNLVALIDVGAMANTPRVGRELLTVQQRLLEHDAVWDATRTALLGARLAAARGASEVTRMLLADAAESSARLRRPALLAERREAVEHELAVLDARASADQDVPGSEPNQPVEREASPHGGRRPSTGGFHGREDNPERELDRLARLRAREPDAPDSTLELAAALREVGRVSMARALLEAHAAARETEPRVRAELAASLLADHDHEALDRLLAGHVELSSAHEPGWLQLRWILGQSLRARGQQTRAVAIDQETLQQVPSATAFRLRRAAVAREIGDWGAALESLERAAEFLPPGNHDWDRIVAATVLGRWTSVRQAARRLELELPGIDDPLGPEPMELNLGVIRCEFIEPSGRRERYFARRTSPCGARIIEIAMPADPQHFQDLVVFEPSDLDAHLSETSERHRPCFEVVQIVQSGRYRAFLLRGFDPGEARFELLRAGLREHGHGVERITNAGRRAADPRIEPGTEAAQVSTVALLVACPPDVSPRELRAQLHELTSDWELPLLAPALDEAAGEPEAAKRASELLQRWQP
jgi:tetratricopeptide (TPR) repeat protein